MARAATTIGAEAPARPNSAFGGRDQAIRGSIRKMRSFTAAARELAPGTPCASDIGADPTLIRLGRAGFAGSPFDHGARPFKERVEAHFPGHLR